MLRTDRFHPFSVKNRCYATHRRDVYVMIPWIEQRPIWAYCLTTTETSQLKQTLQHFTYRENCFFWNNFKAFNPWWNVEQFNVQFKIAKTLSNFRQIKWHQSKTEVSVLSFCSWNGIDFSPWFPFRDSNTSFHLLKPSLLSTAHRAAQTERHCKSEWVPNDHRKWNKIAPFSIERIWAP